MTTATLLDATVHLAPPTSPAPEPLQGLALVDALLRDEPALLERIRAGDVRRAMRTLLLTIALAAGTYGMVLGLFRGGVQVLYAGVKLPLAVLLTASLATPALAAARRAIGKPGGAERDLALVLSALCVGCLVLASLAPVALLAVLMGLDYHRLALLAVSSCLLAGASGVARFWRGLEAASRRERAFLGLTAIAVFLAAGSQMTWTLRPYLVRPKSRTVPFVRTLEGSFLESVSHQAGWATGAYGAPTTAEPDR